MSPFLRNSIAAVLPSIVLLACVSCWSRPPRTDPVERWLTCIDCPNGQLDSVLTLARRAYRPTVAALSQDLLDGPGRRRLAAFDRASRRVHDADSAYAVNHGLHLPLRADSFVARYHVRYDRLWRTRAALALGVIRALPTLASLDSAAGSPAQSALAGAPTHLPALDPFVLAAVLYARDSIPAGTNPYGTILKP